MFSENIIQNESEDVKIVRKNTGREYVAIKREDGQYHIGGFGIYDEEEMRDYFYILGELPTKNIKIEAVSIGDARYNNPKKDPEATLEEVYKLLKSNEIYREARLQIMSHQNKQIAYGIDKYPEPLTADSWSIIETIDHIIDESVDKLHYLVMLKIKLQKQLIEEEG